MFDSSLPRKPLKVAAFSCLIKLLDIAVELKNFACAYISREAKHIADAP